MKNDPYFDTIYKILGQPQPTPVFPCPKPIKIKKSKPKPVFDGKIDINFPEKETKFTPKIKNKEKQKTYLVKYRAQNPYWNLESKLKRFNDTGINLFKVEYTTLDVINYFGPNPICYLTGRPIDFTKPNTFSLDHFIPSSKGGDNSLQNMRVCHPMVNLMKNNMNLDEFFGLCQDICKFNNL